MTIIATHKAAADALSNIFVMDVVASAENAGLNPEDAAVLANALRVARGLLTEKDSAETLTAMQVLFADLKRVQGIE